jgi:hypothetical protein
VVVKMEQEHGIENLAIIEQCCTLVPVLAVAKDIWR